MILSNEIEQMWEICENTGPSRAQYPYIVVCHQHNTPDMGFGCKTLDEAKAKLVSLRDLADQRKQNWLLA